MSILFSFDFNSRISFHYLNFVPVSTWLRMYRRCIVWYIKGTRAQNFGLKKIFSQNIIKTRVSVKKYNVETLTLKNIMTTYLERWKVHENLGEPLFCPMDKNIISPLIEWCIGKSPGLCTIFSKTRILYLKFIFFTQLFWCFWQYSLFPFYAQTVLLWL